jgi:hypothetical protein
MVWIKIGSKLWIRSLGEKKHISVHMVNWLLNWCQSSVIITKHLIENLQRWRHEFCQLSFFRFWRQIWTKWRYRKWLFRTRHFSYSFVDYVHPCYRNVQKKVSSIQRWTSMAPLWVRSYWLLTLMRIWIQSFTLSESGSGFPNDADSFGSRPRHVTLYRA